MESPIMSTADIAKLIGVSHKTIRRYAEDGAFPGSFKTPGGHWRYHRAAVETWLEEKAKQYDD